MDLGGHNARVEEEVLELLLGQIGLDVLDEGNSLEKGHVLAGADRQESNEGDLHRGDKSDDKEGVVGDVDPLRESSHQEEHKHVEGDEIDDEDVASPGGHHVEVGHGCQGTPTEDAEVNSL